MRNRFIFEMKFWTVRDPRPSQKSCNQRKRAVILRDRHLSSKDNVKDIMR